jgi:hypothetical protein
MGKESLQIRKHIEDERARLDVNLVQLEYEFTVARQYIRSCWKNPFKLAAIVIAVSSIIANEFSARKRVEPPRAKAA